MRGAAVLQLLPAPLPARHRHGGAGRGADQSAAGQRLPIGSCATTGDQRPNEIKDYASVRDVPLILGAVLAVLAVATLAHVLLTSVRRRRRDLAMLKTLGLTRPKCCASSPGRPPPWPRPRSLSGCRSASSPGARPGPSSRTAQASRHARRPAPADPARRPGHTDRRQRLPRAEVTRQARLAGTTSSPPSASTRQPYVDWRGSTSGAATMSRRWPAASGPTRSSTPPTGRPTGRPPPTARARRPRRGRGRRPAGARVQRRGLLRRRAQLRRDGPPDPVRPTAPPRRRRRPRSRASPRPPSSPGPR